MTSANSAVRASTAISSVRRTGIGVVAVLLVAVSVPGQIQWTQQIRPQLRGEYATAFDLARNVGVLFGGTRSGTLFGDTWEWDGVRWRRIPLSLAPTAREGHCMTFDFARQEVVLFGGQDTSGRVGDTWTYNGIFWRRHAVATAPSPREDAQMAFDTVRGEVVLFGGFDGGQDDETWAWNGTSWTQLSPASAPPARYRHGLVNDFTGRLFLFGGRGQSGILGDTWEWSGGSWVNVSPGSSPNPRERHSMAFDVARNRAVLYGGSAGGAETWEYLPGGMPGQAGSWVQSIPSQSPPSAQGRSAFYDNSINRTVLFGGNVNDDETWLWSGTNWNAEALSPTSRRFHAAAIDGSGGTAVLFGGSDGALASETWTWSNGEWGTVPLAVQPPLRQNPAMAADATGGVVLFGGFASGFLDDTWRWANGLWTQLPTVNPPAARREHAMTPGPGSTVLLSGGLLAGGANRINDETWTWNGSSWTDVSPLAGGSPSGRYNHAMAYDPVRGRVVLFGGTDGSARNNETWEWDGAGWTRIMPTLAPAAREGHAMVFDSARGVVLLHGGYSGSTSFGDLWSWDGADWTLEATVEPLPEVGDHVLLHDVSSQQNILFGGRRPNGTRTRDTWLSESPLPFEFALLVSGCDCNGSTASQALAPGSAPRLGSSLAIDVSGLPNLFGSAFMLIGFSSTPVSLTPIGIPCTIAVDAPLAVSIPNTFGSASWAATIPVDGTLLGFEFYTQVTYECPMTGGIPLRFSDARRLVVGTK